MKTCYTCGVEKTPDQFSWKVKDVRRSGVCKDCHRDYRRQHYLDNRAKYIKKAKERNHRIPKVTQRYGLSLEQVSEMKSRYDGKCWICKKSEATHVDHDHACCSGETSCGKCVRGLLCSHCNTGLGMFRDSPGVLSSAISYLVR